MTWLISYEESNGKDESCLIIGRSYNDNNNALSMGIIHTLYGQEADIIADEPTDAIQCECPNCSKMLYKNIYKKDSDSDLN